ncbi:hypothetical protein DSM106972_097950 [Dulcicalothrix desertica PCC 7102]|uniref:Uncharacterized protein n=1 Tax=Dulcicalothrix desertica PCC 7102 TaxID=232991 RepID=A0A3S1BPR2_9CYAN|nr:hypothetical protein [Dulcicalothrix desertica]RUS92870.1 hypothetical protein DSM106972_097950 [Dulcicalothrix desertica PCC 7102]TWH39983.1 hypothetical protein CAL7102_09267 [Dulcicalothrix desertica PCC 7102]
MTDKLSIHKNKTSNETLPVSNTSVKGAFELSPSQKQLKNHNSEQPHLGTSLIQAKKYGHHLGKKDLTNQSVSTVQPKLSNQPVQLAGKKRPASSPAGGNPSKKAKSDRPDFPDSYKPTYLNEFNNRPNGQTTLSPNQRLDQTTPKYSRNHRVSYQDQQRLLEQRRQGKITQQQFTQSTNALYPKDTVGNPTGFGAVRMQRYRQQMLAAKTPAEKAMYEKKMATHLNAAPMNVTIGGSKVNSTIGHHFDPNASKSPGGTYSLTPRTKQTFDFGVNNISKPMLSPGGTRIASSHINDRKGGFFPQSALSPTSSGLMNNLMLNGRGNAGHVSPTNASTFPSS